MNHRRSIGFKWVNLDYAMGICSDANAHRKFGIPKSAFYECKRVFRNEGGYWFGSEEAHDKYHPGQLLSETIEKILYLQSKYHFEPLRVVWYLERYPGIIVSASSDYKTLMRNGMKRLPRHAARRAIHT